MDDRLDVSLETLFRIKSGDMGVFCVGELEMELEMTCEGDVSLIKLFNFELMISRRSMYIGIGVAFDSGLEILPLCCGEEISILAGNVSIFVAFILRVTRSGTEVSVFILMWNSLEISLIEDKEKV